MNLSSQSQSAHLYVPSAAQQLARGSRARAQASQSGRGFIFSVAAPATARSSRLLRRKGRPARPKRRGAARSPSVCRSDARSELHGPVRSEGHERVGRAGGRLLLTGGRLLRAARAAPGPRRLRAAAAVAAPTATLSAGRRRGARARGEEGVSYGGADHKREGGRGAAASERGEGGGARGGKRIASGGGSGGASGASGERKRGEAERALDDQQETGRRVERG